MEITKNFACLLGAWAGTVDRFWFNSAPIPTNENDVYTVSGDKINDLFEFTNNPWNEMSNLDMSKKYCAKAWHPGDNGKLVKNSIKGNKNIKKSFFFRSIMETRWQYSKR